MSFLLYAPNVHLFAFHLSEIEDPDSDPDYQPHYLCDRCLEIFHQFQIQQALKLRDVNSNMRIDLLEGTSEENIMLSLEGRLEDKHITGLVGYLQLYDSYALYLNLRIPELEQTQNRTQPVDAAIFQQFNCNQQLILNSSIGQVIILTGWLSQAQQQQEPKIWQQMADYCVQSFLGTSKFPLPPCYQVNQLFGSPVFEYGDPQNPDKTQTIWVWLFFDESEEAQKPSADADSNLCFLDQELLDLFFYRQKMIKTFEFSRENYRETRAQYQKMGSEVKAIRFLTLHKKSSPEEKLSELTLIKLQQSLVELLEMDINFSENLRELEASRLTLKANTSNYRKKLALIQSYYPQEKLDILEIFLNKNCVNFQEQIKMDLGYFRHIRSLADKAVASIRGIVEIEQTQRDRLRQDQEKQLENTIQAIGLAVGIGAIFASSAGLIDRPWRTPWADDRSSYPHPFLIAFFGSLLLAGIFYFGVKWCQNRGGKRKKF